MIKIYNKAYTSAFWKYLRYGSKITEPYYVFKSANGIENDMKFYIWRTKEDHKVRPTHAANNGKVFSYNKPPPTGHPGRAINCRCHDEAIHATFDGDENSVSKYDIDTWPTVPINGKLIEGLPSKAKPRSRGEKSLYDIYGGEWKPHTIDPRHNLHWDYKGRDRCDEWMNIPINGKVPKIIEKSVYKSFKYKEANMLRVRCFDDFDNGPQILIAGMHEDYRHTAQYLSKQQGALLNDKNCFQYYPPLIPFRDEWLVINEKECRELAELFQKIADDSGFGYHHYYDLASQDDTFLELRISIGEYDMSIFEED